MSIGDDSTIEVEDFDYNFEDSLHPENSIEFIENQHDSITELRNEVNTLKKQVKYLRKIAILNIFDSKQDASDFFSDIW